MCETSKCEPTKLDRLSIYLDLHSTQNTRGDPKTKGICTLKVQALPFAACLPESASGSCHVSSRKWHARGGGPESEWVARALHALEGLGSIKTQAVKCLGRGSYCKETEWLELNASQSS